jgi:hypothetical protein
MKGPTVPVFQSALQAGSSLNKTQQRRLFCPDVFLEPYMAYTFSENAINWFGTKERNTVTESMPWVKGKAISLQALTGPEGFRSLRLPDFKTIDTWRWQGCQHYAPYAVSTYLKGWRMARCRSTAMAVSVKTLTLTLSTWTKGQKGHMKCGRFQRCSRAAWNCGNKRKLNCHLKFHYKHSQSLTTR